MYNGIEEIQVARKSLETQYETTKTPSENPQVNKEIWTKALQLLSKKLKKSIYNTWIRPCRLIEIKHDHALIGVINEFARNFIEQSCVKDIEVALREVTASNIGIRLCVDNSAKIEIYEDEEEVQTLGLQKSFASLKQEIQKTPIELNSQQTFKTFISGKSNRLSLLFAKAFLEGNSEKYKSLFIYSEPGLGKTHLLNAIAQQALESDASKKIKITNAESFMNEFIGSINKKTTETFRKKYRELDMLLVDDVQFLQGKKASQEEFMHSIDAICKNGGKLVFTASQNPKELNNLDANLKSRFAGSLQTEILPLDSESLHEILELKAKEMGLNLTQQHFSYLKQQQLHNIRDIEALLLKLSTINEHADYSVDDHMIASLFSPVQFSNNQYRGLRIDDIIETVAAYFGLSATDLRSSKRHKEFSKARHLAIYLAKEILDISYARIGESFSGRKHSSVIHSVKLIKKDLEQDRSLQLVVEDIKSKLNA